MFDPSQFELNGVQLIALVFGLVEFCKAVFGLQGKSVTVLAAILGAVVMALFELVGVVAEPYGQVLGIFVISLAVGLSAAGFYKFVNARAPKLEPPVDDEEAAARIGVDFPF